MHSGINRSGNTNTLKLCVLTMYWSADSYCTYTSQNCSCRLNILDNQRITRGGTEKTQRSITDGFFQRCWQHRPRMYASNPTSWCLYSTSLESCKILYERQIRLLATVKTDKSTTTAPKVQPFAPSRKVASKRSTRHSCTGISFSLICIRWKRAALNHVGYSITYSDTKNDASATRCSSRSLECAKYSFGGLSTSPVYDECDRFSRITGGPKNVRHTTWIIHCGSRVKNKQEARDRLTKLSSGTTRQPPVLLMPESACMGNCAPPSPQLPDWYTMALVRAAKTKRRSVRQRMKASTMTNVIARW